MNKQVFALFVCVLVLATPLNAIKIQPVSDVEVSPLVADALPKVSTCRICVSFFDQALSELIKLIADGGITATCSLLCGQLPEQLLAEVCTVICDFVGIDEFIKLINSIDPDPIFLCEEMNICNHVDDGVAKITSITINPGSAAVGATIELGFSYQVVNKTGPGILVVEVDSEDGMTSAGDSLFVDVQEPGTYQIGFKLKTKPSEDNPFNPGTYDVEFAFCEGDCTDKHKWGGIYDKAEGTFTLTEN